MLLRPLAQMGAVAALLLSAGCAGAGYEQDAWGPPPPVVAGSPPPGRIYADEPGYRVSPKPKPHRVVASNAPSSHAATANDAATDAKKKNSASGNPAQPAASDAKSSGDKVAETGPLTPAEIRGAVPAQNVNDPKQTLSSAQIKSVWGDVLGRVHSVDVAGGKLKSVDANVVSSPGAKPKVVRLDPARLKYVRSRNMLLTTMSKPDLDKLPKADSP